MSKRYKYGFVIMASLWCLALFSLRFNDTVTASNEVIDQASVSIPASCTFSGQGMNTHNATIANGTYLANIGATTMRTFCNDGSGYSIYAIGTSGGVDGTTDLIASVNGSTSPANNIVTGVSTSGALSNWAMKVSPVSGTYAPTITNGFGSYSAVPSSYTKVATFASATDSTIGSSITSTYAVYVSDTQVAGSYTGLVKYTMVHPAIVTDETVTNDAVKIEFYGSGLYFDENNTESVNTMIFRRICESGVCHYALESGEYKVPIGVPNSGKWSYVTSGRDQGITVHEKPVDIDRDAIATILEEEHADGGVYKVFYRNTDNVSYGVFVVGGSPQSYSINVVAYKRNGNTFENVGNVYQQPSSGVMWWALSLGDNQHFIGLIDNEGQPISNEAEFIAAITRKFGQIDLPSGSFILFLPNETNDVLWLDYQDGADGDTVTNMPQSPEEHRYDWLDGLYNVSCTVPQRSGYTFLGWYYSPDTSLAQPCDGITLDAAPNSTVTLIARWGITVTYGAGSIDVPVSNVDGIPEPTTCAPYSECIIADVAPSASTDIAGCSIEFSGWLAPEGWTYWPGDSISVQDSDIALTALWSYSGCD